MTLFLAGDGGGFLLLTHILFVVFIIDAVGNRWGQCQRQSSWPVALTAAVMKKGPAPMVELPQKKSQQRQRKSTHIFTREFL